MIYTHLLRSWQGIFFLTGSRKKGTRDPLLLNYLEKQPTLKITGIELYIPVK